MEWSEWGKIQCNVRDDGSFLVGFLNHDVVIVNTHTDRGRAPGRALRGHRAEHGQHAGDAAGAGGAAHGKGTARLWCIICINPVDLFITPTHA